jgi:molybdate/tungstate transport system substrate-binding protein
MRWGAALAVSCWSWGCGPRPDDTRERALVVFNAGSLALPLRAALDSFAVAAGGVTIYQESAGSLETARKITELGHVADIVAVADYEVIPNLLMPAHATWYAQFARNRMVLAYTARSRGSAGVGPSTWWQVVTRPGVEMGRADPDRDPNGYRTLLVFHLAEVHHGRPGLARELLAAAPLRNVRPKEADLVALLQAGELDYIWSYESMAQAAGLQYVQLPREIDLSDPAHSSAYATASVRVAGRTRHDSVTVRGQPILYALTIPRNAPHAALAREFVAFLASEAGRRALRGARLDALDTIRVVGSGAPAALRSRDASRS